MHEFVFPARCFGSEAAKEVYHLAGNRWSHPDIAVYNPYDIPFCFPVRPAHVPYLGIWSQIVGPAIAPREVRVFFLN